MVDTDYYSIFGGQYRLLMIAVDPDPNDPKGLRILQLTAPAEFGGLETVVSQLSVGLIRRGHTICVGCVLDESADPAIHPLVQELEMSGVPVEVIQVPSRAYRQEGAAVRALIRWFDASVVHTHGYHCDVIGGRSAVDTDVPRVASVHGFTGGGWKNRVYELLQRRSYRSAAAVIAVSRPLAALLSADRSVASRVHVIPNAGIRQADWPARDAARIELGIEGDGFAIGWLGRMSLEKGPDVVVEAMADPRAVDFRLCMIGEGPLRPALERASAISVGAEISWLGGVPKVGRLLKAFDVVVLSSRTEGTPMVLLEAMDAGVPLVATRVGGVPDIVGPEEALLVEPDDPQALLSAILDVSINREAAKRRADNATKRLESQCDPDAWLAAHENVYRSVVRVSPSERH
ncbi:MAG: glycosyltransferase family 1 protein [Gemmatimonadales bacterium]|nr:MAG: glycosyltransferase family 1 protein [Gemmatimonadales bacterium]